MDVYDDINDMRSFFVSNLFQFLDSYAPLHTVPIKNSHQATPWMTSDILRIIKQKAKAKHKATCSADIYYKQLKNKVKLLFEKPRLPI